MFTVANTVQYLENTIWTKMLRKMHVVCLILEYFPLKPGSLKILPPPPKKTMLKCGPNIFAAY